MRALKLFLLVLGSLGIVAGLVWMGQGSGYFPYPAASFMIDQTPWIWRGLGTAIVGAVLVIQARRM